jgi:CRISPR/Cas system-associated endonuclease Cas1
MSKIEVDAIEPQSGTTLTLGASGDTINLAIRCYSAGFGKVLQVVSTSTTSDTSNNFNNCLDIGFRIKYHTIFSI